MPATRKKRVEPLPVVYPRRVDSDPLAPQPTFDTTQTQGKWPRRFIGNVDPDTGAIWENPPDETRQNVLNFPTRNPAPAVSEVPLELPTYTRPRVTSPVVTSPDPSPPAIALPTRNRRTQPRDMVADDSQYLSDLQTMPIEKMSRKKAALAGALRALSLVAQGGPGAMAGGALTGAVLGAALPGRTAKIQREDEIAKASGNLNTEINREGHMAQVQATRELAAQRKAAPEAARLAAEDKAKEQERDNLRQLYNAQPNFDPDKNPEHKNLRDRAAVLGMLLPRRDEKEAFSLQWKNGQLKRVSSRTGEVSDIVDKGQPFVDDARVPVVEDGLTVTPGQALSARATRGSREYQRGRDVVQDTRHDTERTEDQIRQDTQREQARQEKAAGIAGEVEAANAEAKKYDRLAATAPDADTKKIYEGYAEGAKAEANAKALELSQGYSDIYEAGPGEKGWAYVKPKAKPALPTRSTTNGGSVRPRVTRQKLSELLGVQ